MSTAKPRRPAKAYRRKMYVMMTSVCLVLVSSVLWILYAQMQRVLLEKEARGSRQVLAQTAAQIDYMMGVLNATTYAIYNNPDAVSLMYCDPKPEVHDYIVMLNRLTAQSVKANPAVHSVYLYNNRLETFFSTYKSMYYLDADFSRRVTDGALLLRDFPLLRRVDGQFVCTQVLADSFTYAGGAPTNAVYVNYRFDWLLDNLRRFAQDDTGASLFLVDKEGNCVSAFLQHDTDAHAVEQDLLASRALFGEGEDSTDIVTTTIHGTRCAVSTITTQSTGWQLFKIVPLSVVMQDIVVLRNVILVANLLAVLAILGLYGIVTKQLYRPVDKMLTLVPEEHTAGADEFSLVESYYLQQLGEVKALRALSETNAKLLEEPVIHRLLYSGYRLSQQEFAELYNVYRFHIDFAQPYRVCVCSFDDMGKLAESFDTAKDNMLILSTMKQAVKDCVGACASFDYAYTNDECMAVLVQSATEHETALCGALQALQQRLAQECSSTASVSVSVCTQGYRAVSASYSEALERLALRVRLGRGALILPQTGQPREKALPDYNALAQTRLLSAIGRGNCREAAREIPLLAAALGEMSLSAIAPLLTLLTDGVRGALVACNARRAEPVDVERAMQAFAPARLRFLEDVSTALYELLDTLEQEKGALTAEQATALHTAQQLVETHAADPALGAALLSQETGVSAVQLGRLFKRHTGKTIPEYINDVRLEKAAKWIKNSALTVSEIAQRAGYQNESYFFRVFKEKYGITPRQYESKYRDGAQP